MTIADLQFILAHFDDSKRYIDGGYYRIRTTGYDEYELAFLVPDSCGSTTIHPQIKVKVEGNCLVPQVLIDLGTSPTQYIHYNSETSAQLDMALSTLVAKFYAAYESTTTN